MANRDTKDVNAAIDYDLAEKFYAQVNERGQKVKRAVAGAIRCWISMTPTEQNLWIENKTKSVFSADPQENEIYSLIDQGARIFAEIDTKIRRSEAASEKNKKNRRSRG